MAQKENKNRGLVLQVERRADAAQCAIGHDPDAATQGVSLGRGNAQKYDIYVFESDPAIQIDSVPFPIWALFLPIPKTHSLVLFPRARSLSVNPSTPCRAGLLNCT